MQISVVIPTYNMKGNGVKFLNRLLSTIYAQTQSADEIVISNHSDSDIFNRLIDYWSTLLTIKYIINNDNYGSISHNINNAIINSNKDVIVPLFQDDYILHNNYFQSLYSTYNNYNTEWTTSNSITKTTKSIKLHDSRVPRLKNNLLKGVNTIGPPSVISYKFKSNLLFDNNLKLLTDCELYYRLLMMNGKPRRLTNYNIVSDIWGGNTQFNIDDTDISIEYDYIKTKHTK